MGNSTTAATSLTNANTTNIIININVNLNGNLEQQHGGNLTNVTTTNANATNVLDDNGEISTLKLDDSVSSAADIMLNYGKDCSDRDARFSDKCSFLKPGHTFNTMSVVRQRRKPNNSAHHHHAHRRYRTSHKDNNNNYYFGVDPSGLRRCVSWSYLWLVH